MIHVTPRGSELTLLNEKLGEGKHGTTYKGIYNGIIVAVKSIRMRYHTTEDDIETIDEIAALIKLLPICIPYAVCIFDAFIEGSFLYMITELINGYDLLSYENRDFGNKPLREMVKGLKVIHNIGVAHKDIHGHNIMYDKDFDIYRYIDFGQTKKLLNKSTPEEEAVPTYQDTIHAFTGLMQDDFDAAVQIVDTVDVNLPLHKNPVLVTASELIYDN